MSCNQQEETTGVILEVPLEKAETSEEKDVNVDNLSDQLGEIALSGSRSRLADAEADIGETTLVEKGEKESGNEKEESHSELGDTSKESDEKVNRRKHASSSDGGSSEQDEDDDEENEKFVTADEDFPDFPQPTLGIEDETVIAQYRCKLYVYDHHTGGLVERGLGDIILLQSQGRTDVSRVVMWRDDGTGQLACNCRIFEKMNVKTHQSDPRFLVWQAQNYADMDDPIWETFICRFQDGCKCTDFKNNMIRLAKLISQTSSSKETNCAGCIGCNSPDFKFQHIKKKQAEEPLINCSLCADSCNGSENQQKVLENMRSDL